MGEYEKLFERNIGVLTKAEQVRLQKARVAICGAGGLGGIVFQMLLRTGVGNFTIADGDRFEKSNFNRQVLANYSTLGRRKADVAAEFAKRVNRGARVRKFGFVDEKNVSSFIRDVDVVVDCLDNPLSRVIVSRECRRQKIPFVFGAAAGTSGMCSVMVGYDFETAFCLPSRGKKIEEARVLLANYPKGKPILGVVPAMVGSAQVMQALAVLLGKPCVKAPNFIFISAFSKEPFAVRKI